MDSGYKNSVLVMGMLRDRRAGLRLSGLATRLWLFTYCVLAYSDWPRILVVRISGVCVPVKIRGTELRVKVDPRSIRQCMLFARCLALLGLSQIGGQLRILAPINYSEDIEVVGRGWDAVPLRWLGWVASLARCGAKLYDRDSGFIMVELEGLKWVVRKHSEDIRLGPLLGHGFENHEYRRWFRRLIGPGSVFVDVGANVGGYAVRAAKLGAMVYALEPSIGTFAVLQRNMRNNRLNFEAYNLAAGSRSTEGVIYGRRGHEGKFSLKPFKGATIRERVKITRLDELLLNRLERVDLLKIDVEGAEKDVLEGAQGLLKISMHVMLELRDLKLADWLERNGFRVNDVGSSFGRACNVLFDKV